MKKGSKQKKENGSLNSNKTHKIASTATSEHVNYTFIESPIHVIWLLIGPIFLAGLAWLFYYPSLSYRFQFDDVANIQKMFHIRSLTFGESFLKNPRWLPFWINAINYRLGKFNPFYFRLFNVWFHIFTGILLFYVIYLALWQLRNNSFFKQQAYAIAYASAALFLLHPVQTQTVSYVIQGRMEGLAGLFTIALVLCFLLITHFKSLFMRSMLTLLLFALALFASGTKEIAIIAPALVLLTDWFFIAQGNWYDLKNRLWLHGALFIIVFGMYIYFLKPNFFYKIASLQVETRNNIGNVLTERPGEKILPIPFFISQFKVIIHYIFMFLWPFNISVEYDWKLVSHFFAADCIFPLLLLLIILGCIFYILKNNKINPIAFGALWFFIGIAPRSSIIPSSELLADYKTYIASVGILFIIASALIYCIMHIVSSLHMKQPIFHKQVTSYALLTLLMAQCGFFTYSRNKVWRSSEEFWSNIIENAPDKARAYNNLAVALAEQGKITEAIPLYKKAISMDRNYPDPWNNLAVCYSMTNRLPLAIEALKQAININKFSPEAYNNLASFYIQQKNYDLAEKALDMALKLRPHYGKAYFNLGKLYLEKEDAQKALENFKIACTQADLDNESGYSIYGQAALHFKKYEDAIYAYSQLVKVRPDATEYHTRLGHAYALNNQHAQALEHYQVVLKTQNNNASIWFNIGECYLHTAQPQKALEAFEKAKELKMQIPQLNVRIAACLKQLGRTEEAKKYSSSLL